MPPEEYLVSVIPARGWRYRRRSDGTLARVVIYSTSADSVRLWDRSGGRHCETVEGFWSNWTHVDLYDPRRN